MFTCILSYAVWSFRYAHFAIVHSDLIPIFTEVARTVVILVFTMRDNYVADVVLLSLAGFANLIAYST